MAFKSWGAQIALSNIEDNLYKKKLQDIEVFKPVFISALPRAGTTLLLDLIVQTDEFVSHTYRYMPFLLTPLFWNSVTNSFHKSDTPRERAHGDGMLVSVDSPEAFEEIIWRQFWPSRYEGKKIEPQFAGEYAEFAKFFINHIRKVIFLGTKAENELPRYISKNNLNIVRLGYIRKILPDAKIIVPFRDPLQHASSLLKQHRNFLAIHKDDSFARDYMEAIGHYDFGENLRPVNFNKWLTSGEHSDRLSLDFWLDYWNNAYAYLLDHESEHVQFLAFDTFCQHPGGVLAALVDFLEIKNGPVLLDKASQVRSPRLYSIDRASVNSEILDKSETLYEQLLNNSHFSA